jgi:hypothetical protein
MMQNLKILMRVSNLEYINQRQSEFNINVRYAHVSEYIGALYNTSYTWPEYSGDFFPYNDKPASYWTVRKLSITTLLYQILIIIIYYILIYYFLTISQNFE